MKRGYAHGRICGCGEPMSDRAKRCKPCLLKELAADPERGAKIGRALRERLKDPANHARLVEAAKRGGRTKSRDLEWCERAAKLMREKIQPLSMTPEALARRDHALCGRLAGEAKLAWCPPEMRPRYRRLTKGLKMKKAEAQPLVMREWDDIQAARSGNIDSAVHWLTRLTPVRKRDDGTFQYGSAILTAGEIIKRAELKGWKPANDDLRERLAG